MLNLILLFQACNFQVATICTVGAGTIIYNAGSSLIRFLYIRSSLAMNVQEVLKRDSFVIKSIIIGESLCVFNFISFFVHFKENSEGSPWVLYRACLNPWRKFQFPLTKLTPVNQMIGHMSIMINICCNLWLCRYLNKMTMGNTALQARDRKRDRKRNLLPAKIGFISLVFHVISTLTFTFTYSHKSTNFDSATRAFLMLPMLILFTVCFLPWWPFMDQLRLGKDYGKCLLIKI